MIRQIKELVDDIDGSHMDLRHQDSGYIGEVDCELVLFKSTKLHSQEHGTPRTSMSCKEFAVHHKTKH